MQLSNVSPLQVKIIETQITTDTNYIFYLFIDLLSFLSLSLLYILIDLYNLSFLLIEIDLRLFYQLKI